MGGPALTDDIPPIVYRANHAPLGGGGELAVEHAPATADVDGLISHPMGRAIDTLAALHRRGTIDGAMLAAGRQFEEDFQASGLCELRAQDLSAMRGGTVDPHVLRVLASRHRVWEAIEALGGGGAPIALSAWHVLGMGRTLKDYASLEGFAPDRPLHPMTAQGLLIGALSVLAGHYSRTR